MSCCVFVQMLRLLRLLLEIVFFRQFLSLLVSWLTRRCSRFVFSHVCVCLKNSFDLKLLCLVCGASWNLRIWFIQRYQLPDVISDVIKIVNAIRTVVSLMKLAEKYVMGISLWSEAALSLKNNGKSEESATGTSCVFWWTSRSQSTFVSPALFCLATVAFMVVSLTYWISWTSLSS